VANAPYLRSRKEVASVPDTASIAVSR
jgi:hypothetical protein